MEVFIAVVCIISIFSSIIVSVFAFWAFNKISKFSDRTPVGTVLTKPKAFISKASKKAPVYHADHELWRKEQKEVEHRGPFI